MSQTPGETDAMNRLTGRGWTLLGVTACVQLEVTESPGATAKGCRFTATASEPESGSTKSEKHSDPVVGGAPLGGTTGLGFRLGGICLCS